MPSKHATTSNVRYDQNMQYDITCMCVIAREGLLNISDCLVYYATLIAFSVVYKRQYTMIYKSIHWQPHRLD